MTTEQFEQLRASTLAYIEALEQDVEELGGKLRELRLRLAMAGSHGHIHGLHAACTAACPASAFFEPEPVPVRAVQFADTPSLPQVLDAATARAGQLHIAGMSHLGSLAAAADEYSEAVAEAMKVPEPPRKNFCTDGMEVTSMTMGHMTTRRYYHADGTLCTAAVPDIDVSQLSQWTADR